MERCITDDFVRFQSLFPLQRVHLPRSELEWCYYQAAPSCPTSGSGSEAGSRSNSGNADTIIFLHGTSGVAAAFFYQVEALASKGYKVFSVQYPAYYSVDDWCKGFDHFLDAVKCRAVHVFGAGIGGFLAQHFACKYPQRIRSLLLCNSFGTTYPFEAKAGSLATVVHFTPTPLLRKVMLDSFPQGVMELSSKQAIDWVAHQVNDLSGDDLAARLTLNCTGSSVGDMRMPNDQVMILESSGDTMVPEEVRRDLQYRYPDARLAQLKAGGDFPYLSRPEEVTLFVEVHLRGVGASGHRDVAPSPALEEASANLTSSREAMADESSKNARGDLPRKVKWVNPFEDDPLL